MQIDLDPEGRKVVIFGDVTGARQAVRRFLAPLLHALPVLELAAGHDVARIGKGRDPAPVFEAGVPADVIPVQVSAHHVVDILDLDSLPG